MLKELEALGNGDPTPILGMLNQTASALIQMLPKQDEAQHLTDVLNPPSALRQPEQGQDKDNYINPDLAPRPGR